jgi:hypothetical protein
MRKILIDNALEKKVNDFCDTIFYQRRFDHPRHVLQKIIDNAEGYSESELNYLKKLSDKYFEILKVKPAFINQLIREFDNIIDSDDLKSDFAKVIIDTMRYEDFRKREYLNIVMELGIKACVYCNAQLALVIDIHRIQRGPRRGEMEREGKFEVDHYYSKSKYPFLCTSFYNLIPCCSNCNRSKSTTEAQFYPYTTNPEDVDCFSFSLNENSLDEYWLTNDKSSLIVNFNANNPDLLVNHKELFRIEEIYATQKDVAEEIILKKKAYTADYKKYLVSNFKDLFPDNALVNRLLVGNYTKPEEIHKRPLAKFMQDIARQVGLIS